MTTQAQMDANKRNALRSTGPKTKKGKKASKANAASHGLLAISPVLPGEDAKFWLAFSDAIRSNLSPVGALEEELVNRIVLVLWRHKRLNAYEVALSADKINKMEAASAQEPSNLSKLKREIKKAEEYKHLWQSERELVRLMQKGDQNKSINADQATRYFELISETVGQNGYDLFNPEFLKVLGIEEALLRSDVDPYDVVSWNVGHLHQAADFFAQLAGCDRDKAIDQLRNDKEENYIEKLRELKELKKQLIDLSAQHEVEVCRIIARNCMLAQAEMEKVCRYEAHLQRQFGSTFERLKLLQSSRLNGQTEMAAVAVGISLNPNASCSNQGLLLDEVRLDSVVPRHLKQVHAIEQPLGC